MSNPLGIYLHDHLAGSRFAIDLLESLRNRYSGEPLGQLASSLLVEIKQERDLLQRIVDKVGKGSPDLKEAAAWLAEKVSRFKLSHADAKDFAAFEALEALSLGIVGRRALWRALIVIAESDGRLAGLNFEQLISTAESQYNRVEESRLALARTAF